MATLQQQNHVEIVSGAAEKFVVVSTMLSATIPTELPHLHVFVFTIVDPIDPQDDEFTRVATVADLSLLPQSRDAAVTASSTTYLQTACTVSFDNLTDALTGAQVLQDRVNQLVSDWESFAGSFDGTHDYVFPSSTPSQKQALINAYAAAKQAGYAQLQVANAAAASVTSATAKVTDLSAQVAAVTGFVASATLVKNDVIAETNAFTTLKSAGDVFLVAASCAATGDKDTFQAALNVGANQETLNTGYIADATTAEASLNTYLGTVSASLAAAQTALSSAQANNILQQQTLATDNATTAAALSALLAVAPDFDPTTVPFVPG